MEFDGESSVRICLVLRLWLPHLDFSKVRGFSHGRKHLPPMLLDSGASSTRYSRELAALCLTCQHGSCGWCDLADVSKSGTESGNCCSRRCCGPFDSDSVRTCTIMMILRSTNSLPPGSYCGFLRQGFVRTRGIRPETWSRCMCAEWHVPNSMHGNTSKIRTSSVASFISFPEVSFEAIRSKAEAKTEYSGNRSLSAPRAVHLFLVHHPEPLDRRDDLMIPTPYMRIQPHSLSITASGDMWHANLS